MNERKPLRLKGYHYGQGGYYFVTVCTKGRRAILSFASVGAGHLAGPTLHLTARGQMVEEAILNINAAYPNVSVDKYVVMPNHIHLILRLEQGPAGCPAPTELPKILGAWKSLTSRAAGETLWQRSFYDHVIRNEADYLRIWNYIDTNPLKWTEDEYYIKS